MSLSNDLLSQFAKLANKKPTSTESTVYGTVKEYGGSLYVQLDGSELLTPVTTTANYKAGDRVAVTIKNHTATVTGNLTSPAATTSEVEDVNNKVINVEKVVADKVDTKLLEAEKARIDELEADNAEIHGTLTAQNGIIETLEADNVTINKTLTAQSGKIGTLESDNVKINKSLEAANAVIYNLDSTYATIKSLEATNAEIANLNTVYANIDFSNIKMAAVEKIFSDSGIIKDLVVDNGAIAGELVGVTIKGDLIEAGTLKADRLVVKGSDGNYYKLNTDFDAEAMDGIEPIEEDQIHGSTLVKKSIVAEKIAVDDLVAFGATIGGFHITDDALYSGVKESVNNTTRGIYMDNAGQICFGDSNNFVKFYKDENGNYKLAISAQSIAFGSGRKSIEDEFETLKDEVSTILRIESSRGTVFKNDSISTVLSAVIYRGAQRITDMETLKEAMGNSVYLQWKWQRLNEDSFGVISADDTRIGNDGFTFTLSPDDVDTKVTFMCELIT